MFELDWKAVLSFKQTVSLTMEWYKEFYENCNNKPNSSMSNLTFTQIEKYIKIAKLKGLTWNYKKKIFSKFKEFN